MSKFAPNLIQDYVLFWKEEGIDDDKWLAKKIKERNFRKGSQVGNEYFLIKHQHKLYISCLYSLKDKLSAAELTSKRLLLAELEKDYTLRRAETLLWLAKNIGVVQQWVNEPWLESLKVQLLQTELKDQELEENSTEYK